VFNIFPPPILIDRCEAGGSGRCYNCKTLWNPANFRRAMDSHQERQSSEHHCHRYQAVIEAVADCVDSLGQV
jgi:hypothetical protein